MWHYCTSYFSSHLGGENTTNPTRMGCRAEHTEIYYKQTSRLTAFSPFIYLKERKSMAKAIAQPALQGTSCCGTEQLPRVTHHWGNWRGKRGVLPPSELQPQKSHIQHRWPASPTPLEQLPPTATWCQQRILHLHTGKNTVNNEI